MSQLPSQSALQGAANSAAELIGQLGWAMYLGAGAIFILVMSLAIYGVFGRSRQVSARYWIVGGGLIFPAVTLTALLVYSLAVGNAIATMGSGGVLQLVLDCFGIGDRSQPEPSDRLLRVHVVAKQWWWEVRYERENGEPVVLANELRIPVDRPVELVLTTTDVIHSLWIPALAGKIDMIPGRTTRLHLQTSDRGRFNGLCAEYCGGQHALMKLITVSLSQEQFDAWLELQARPAGEPSDDHLRIGYDAFFKGNCHACHAVRGTPAIATTGPDLTHVGGRESLAAGVLDNHVGTMAGWIAGAQDIKPGNKMPSPPLFTGVELRALAAWLDSLE